RRKGEPPLVSHALPFIGAAIDFGKDPLNYLKNLQSKHGDVFTIKLAGWDYHVFMNPLDVRSLERAKFLGHQEIIGDFVTRMVGNPHKIHSHDFIPELHTADGKSKKTLSPGAEVQKKLTHSIEKNLRGSMQLNSLCESCKPGVIKLHDFCKRVIFDITFNLLFGSLPDYDESCKETSRMYDVFKLYFKRSALLVDRIPIHLLPETKKARTEFLKLMEGIEWSKRENVSRLIQDIVDVNPKLGNCSNFNHVPKRARHLLVVLWAAQANTTPAFFWILFYLLSNPDAKRAVMEEYEQLKRHKHRNKQVKERGNDGWPTMQDILGIKRKDLDRLVILDGCLKETMRLTGASLSVRKASREEKIKTVDGRMFSIRKGDYTAYFASVTHMDEEIFENPQDFVHDRFLVSADEPRSRFSKHGQRVAVSRAIMTFGFGATRCPGRHIAMIEIKLAVLALLRHFDVRFANPNEKTPEFDLSHLGFGVMPPATDIDVLVSLKQP
uniref:Uncharacterized protein n=1 Tax=Ciona savignyi TaxID=51511 RepID=H2Y5Q0_CIOSA